jgi:pilus assembly protein CpaD
MVSPLQALRVRPRARPALTVLTVLVMAAATCGCWTSPRFQSPFALSNPSERHPIAVREGEVALDLPVHSGSSGLNQSQKAKVANFLRAYQLQSTERLLIRAPSGGPNETAARRAYNQIRRAMYGAGLDPRAVVLEPYYADGNPSAPLRLSYLQFVAAPPDCPDWSENIGRDPQNMPWPNKGCATQRNLAAMVANPEDLVRPRGETPRPGERRDVTWGKYVKGDVSGSKWAPRNQPLSEHATTSEVDAGGGQ